MNKLTSKEIEILKNNYPKIEKSLLNVLYKNQFCNLWFLTCELKFYIQIDVVVFKGSKHQSKKYKTIVYEVNKREGNSIYIDIIKTKHYNKNGNIIYYIV